VAKAEEKSDDDDEDSEDADADKDAAAVDDADNAETGEMFSVAKLQHFFYCFVLLRGCGQEPTESLSLVKMFIVA